ncbi:MAG: adenylate/guanylate cyclase domain-containing protein [Eudoraea sp.]|uniref:adenylate/guanylate cyclase domain-containing protein n=1 Tax=Eudoraea sp. TaxID=1979955 RepID=UPI003C75F94B
MKLSYNQKRKFRTVLWITLSWTFISMIQLLYEVSILNEYGFEYRWSTSGNFMTYFLINSLAFVLNGFIGGLIVVFFLQSWIRNRSYSRGLLYGMLIYVVLFFLMTFLQNYFVIDSMWDGKKSFSDAYATGLKNYFFSHEFIRMFPFWLLVLIGTLITLFINDKYGPGVFRKFLTGRYFEPKSEERIFMFLDLKSSTQIAEKLGELKYFRFLQQIFKDITPVLLATKAEVYQYVGDEIVISWNIEDGIKDLNCVKCFQDIQKLLKESEQVYERKYGAIPYFKAGLHVGRATVGEVGVIKRDIVYSGDVLNTTARIQSKCNELGVPLLISENLIGYLPKDKLHLTSLGKIALRGKSETLSLFTIP